jgi:hypothetical protein
MWDSQSTCIWVRSKLAPKQLSSTAKEYRLDFVLTSIYTGIALMAQEAEELHEEGCLEELADLNQQISTAFCSLAELYLTDLWFVSAGHAACDQIAMLKMPR